MSQEEREMAEYFGIDAMGEEIEQQKSRIRELERQVVQLSADRDRLIQCVLKNPCRVALGEMLEMWDRDVITWNDRVENTFLDTDVIKSARKALADTEHEVRK